MVEEAKERRLLTPAERAVRNVARQVEAEKAMSDHERCQKAFYERPPIMRRSTSTSRHPAPSPYARCFTRSHPD
jgi:hypothetical protein